MIRRPPRSTLDRSSAASDVYKRQAHEACRRAGERCPPRVRATLLIAGSTLHYGAADLTSLLDEAWRLAEGIVEPERALGGWFALLLDYRRFHDPDAISRLQQLAGSEDKEVASFAAEMFGRALMSDIANRPTLEQAASWLRRAGDWYEQRGDQWAFAGICQMLAIAQSRLGDYPGALAWLDRADAIYATLEDWQNTAAIGFLTRSAIARWSGRPDLAMEAVETALNLIREHGDRVMEALGLGRLSMDLVRYGDIDRARETRERSLALVRELAHQTNEPWNLWELGEVHRVAGSPAEARRYYEAAGAIFRAQGHGFGMGYYERGLGDMALMALSLIHISEPTRPY